MYNIRMRHIFVSMFIFSLFVGSWLIYHPEQASKVYSFIGDLKSQIAAVIISHTPKSVIEIKAKYARNGSFFGEKEDKVKILIVPGHEPDYGGAEYANIKEREMVVDLANNLKSFIQGNDRYEVYVTRNKYSWENTFSDYFTNNWNDIVAWTKENKKEMEHLERIGEYHPVVAEVKHNVAPPNVAWRLFGISKWSNENDVDIIIHVHFNDHPGHSKYSPGWYSGFAIYVPEDQFFNSTTTKALANSVFNRLKKFNAVSNMPGEMAGIVESPDLIAVGAYNSINAPSMLIEYGYIYEPQFTNENLRDLAIKDLAFQTYLGLQDFFDDKNPINNNVTYDTLIMPHVWDNKVTEAKEVYSLQTALVVDGVYPPVNKSLNDCPRTGVIGSCTKSAIEAFQKKRGISGENGELGPKTLQELNRLYSNRAI